MSVDLHNSSNRPAHTSPSFDHLPDVDRRRLAELPGLEMVDLITFDVNGLRRGKRIPVGQLDKAYHKGFCLPYSVYALDITGDTVERTGYGFQTGDRDGLCRPVSGSLRPVGWTDPPSAQVLVEMFDDDGQAFAANPRVVLRQVVAALKAAGAYPVAALEYEFYLLDGTLDDSGLPHPPVNPHTKARDDGTQVYSIDSLDHYHDFIRDVCVYARSQGIEAESIISEYAPGQFEINIPHSADILSVCDRMIFLKHIIKAVASKNGLCATFMAKPYAELSGSGAHLHLSLTDADGTNLFASSERVPNKWMSWVLGGLRASLDDLMLLFAPHINSYRRFQEYSFVPLSGSWAYNNRSVAFRIPKSDAANSRIEHRVAGADANPYLLTAAVLAGALSGILRRENAGAPSEAGQENPRQTIPVGMAKAIELFENSDRVRELLNPTFADLYLNVKRGELENFRRRVTPLECQWYLHQL